MEKQNKYFLTGDKIYLREVRVTDVNENYYRWLNDSEVSQYLETRYVPRSIENIKKYVESMDGKSDEIFLAICLKENDKHIGNIKLGPVNFIHKFGDISLLIGEKDYWGKGIAYDAIKTLTEFAFKSLNMHKLKAGCYAGNIGSAKAFEKAGFTREGIFKKQWMVNGEYQDEIVLGLCYEDWQGKK